MRTKDLDHSNFIIRYEKSSVDEFDGVTLEELPQLENFFETNIFVYSLESLEDQPRQSTAHPIYRSQQRFDSTMYLNLYQNHFSFIKNIKKYSKSFTCSRCGKYWKDEFMLNRHEKTCDAKVRYNFPGGVFTVTKTIFDLLEEKGIDIPENLKFFPFRAAFDFESMFVQTNLPNDTARVHWQAQHVPLSVSVCSNVPDFDKPHCFVTDGDSKILTQDLIDYLLMISDKSYELVRQRFENVFTEIEKRILLDEEDQQQTETEEEQDVRGINVMDSDDDDEEYIESETEEDWAFLNDDFDEEEDHTFYRALNHELDKLEEENEEEEEEEL